MISANLIKKLKSAGYEGEFDLESMIKECGEDFDCLMYEKDHKPNSKWICNHWADSYGKTPSEAVGSFLLKLLKK